MTNNEGALAFNAIIANQAQFEAQLRSIENGIRNIGGEATRQGQLMDNAFNKAGAAMASYFSLQAMAGFGTQLITVRGEFQKMDIAFTTMLGNKEKSDKLMSEVVTLAAKTPFTLQQVGSGAKQLLAFQVPANEVIDTLTRLGNVAAGVSVPVDRLILAYGQVKAKGKLQGDDLRQFTESGIPMIHELSKSMGVAESSISKMVEAGQIGFPEVQKVISNLTNEGGMFYNMMEAQSKSLSGMMSNLEDAWSQALNKMGTANQGALEGGINLATEVVKHFQDIIDITKVIVATYGAYKAAVVAVSVAQKAQAAIAVMQDFLKRTVMLTRAHQALAAATELSNAAAAVNPYVAIATALTLAITALIVFKKQLSASEMAEAELEKRHDSVKVSVDRQTMAYRALAESVSKTKPGTEERKKAVAELQAKYGTYLPKLDLVNASEREYAKALSLGNAELNKRQVLNSTLGQLKSSTSDYLIAKEAERRTVRDYQKTRKDDTKSNFQISMAFDTMQQAIEDRKAKEIVYNKLKQEFDALKGGAGAVDTTADPFAGLIKYSEDYWKEVIKQAEAARSKIADNSSEGKAAIAKQTATIVNAQKHIDDINNKKQKDPAKTFDEQQSAIKKKYDDYYQWANSADEGVRVAGDKVFSELLKKGASYADYLKRQKEAYEKIPAEKRTKEQTSEYQKVVADLQEAQGGKGVVETFTENLEKSKKEALSLSEYLKVISDFQNDYKGNTSEVGIKINKKLQEERNAAEAKQYEDTSALIEANKSYVAQQLEIDRKYAEDKELIAKRITDATAKGDKKGASEASGALAGVDEKYKADTDAAKQAAFEKTQLYKDLNKYIDNSDRKQLVNLKSNLEEAVRLRSGDQNEQESNILKLADLKKKIYTLDIESFCAILDNVSKVSSAFGELGGSAGEFAKELSSSASMANELMTAIGSGSEKAAKEGAISAVFSVVTSSITTLITQRQKEKQAAEEYYKSIIAQQDQYNLLLNTEIRLKAEKSKNIFTTDYKGNITSAYAAMADAQTKYNDTITKLQDEGQIKVAVKYKDMWGFKKTKIELTSLSGYYGDMLIKNGKLNTTLAQTLIDQNQIDDATKEQLKTAIELQTAYEDAQKQISSTLETLIGGMGSNLEDALLTAFKNGTDAGVAMFAAINDALGNYISKMAYATAFNNDLTVLQKETEASLSQTGDQSLTDDFSRFYAKVAGDTEIYNQIMKAAQEGGAAAGLELFKTSSTTSTDTNSLSGSIKGASQETVNVVAGQVTAIRINQQLMIDSINRSLQIQQRIATGTDHLEEIRDLLKSDNSLRAKGL